MGKKWIAVIAILLLCLGAGIGHRYQAGKGMRFVQRMNVGMNLGNSLDVVGVREYEPDASTGDYETYWGNPATTKEMIDAIAEKGFQMIRIPVSWGEHLDGQGNIEQVWMARVTEVVDWAVEDGLYVVLDLHHESWLVPSEEKEAQTTAQLCSLWEQIADNFKDYDEHLMFEGMNEPRLAGSPEEWTAGTPELRQVVNRLNGAFVETVRASGGENKKRWLLIPAYCTSARTEALEALEMPEDSRLIVAVHAYLPYTFTLDENGAEEWREDDPGDTEEITVMMETLDRLFLQKKIPVVITEFGCIEKEDESERMAWASYYLDAARERGIPCIWWDNGNESRIFDRNSLEWNEELTALLLGEG